MVVAPSPIFKGRVLHLNGGCPIILGNYKEIGLHHFLTWFFFKWWVHPLLFLEGRVLHLNGGCSSMAEHSTVARDVAGSNPVSHPNQDTQRLKHRFDVMFQPFLLVRK